MANDLSDPAAEVGGLTRARLLDPRPADEANAHPIADSVNIPLAELPDRIHELPPPGMPVHLPDIPASLPAVDWLAQRGRVVHLDRFEEGARSPGRLWEPNTFLAEVAPRLSPGVALDVGCGSGRDAVYLASLGWRVLAVDVLPDAVARGRDLAARYLHDPTRVEWRVADVRSTPIEGAFDLIVMFAFLHRPFLARVAANLNEGGSLLLETFTTEHRARHGRPASPHLALDPNEIESLAPGLRATVAEAAWQGNRHLGRLWAKKPLTDEAKQPSQPRR